ncbi:MAG: phosphate ABC transporter permease subunit PstC [Myxococcales bacterium]|nr:MAG: phosphate ABC transporter permease subunit PstC [Myxococcales bacterium]
MSPALLTTVLLGLCAGAYYVGRGRALAISDGDATRLHSLPSHHGLYVALWCGVPSLLLVLAWLSVEPLIADQIIERSLSADAVSLEPAMRQRLLEYVKRLAGGDVVGREIDDVLRGAADRYTTIRTFGNAAMTVVALSLAVAGLALGRGRIAIPLRARHAVEGALGWAMITASTLAVLTTLGIVLSLVFETLRFFDKVPILDFLFGLRWSPQTAMRADQVGSTGTFGAIPLFTGTLLITLIAMSVAVPIGLYSAIYMSEYASRRVRAIAKPTLEILAGVPTVVYGFFAALTVAPFFRQAGGRLGLNVASESALAAGIVMGIMIIPFVSSLSDDAMNAVPRPLREGAYALGATQSETIKQVVLPAALPGIVGAVLLAVSRAIGETMIVVMAAGLTANLTLNPLAAVTTVTVQIVSLLVGDQEFDSAKTLAAFALGLVLFVTTLGLNVIALTVVRRYRERYD